MVVVFQYEYYNHIIIISTSMSIGIHSIGENL